MPYVRSGASAGTTGQGLQAEAVQILLTGNLAKQYDVIYRVHVASKGWLPFTKNGGVAGSTGIGLRIEAIQIKLVKKNSTESRKVTGAGARLSKPKFTATAHVQDLAWLNPVGEGAIIGTTKQGKNLEGLKLMMPDIDGKGNVIMARAHVSDEGWQNYRSGNNLIGTTGKSHAIECIEMKLTGAAADVFDIYYRTYAGGRWMGWAKNGAPSGTTGGSVHAEAIQVRIVNKGSAFNTEGTAYINYTSKKGSAGIRLQHHMTGSLRQGNYGGNFAKNGCVAMSYAVGLSIINNRSYNPTNFYKAGVGAYYPNGGYWVGSYKPAQNASDLKAGKPSIFYMNYGSGRKHAVLIIGLKAGASETSPSYGDFIVIDPASGNECMLTSAYGFSSFRSVNNIRRF